MADYILSKKAQDDLRKIWHYTAETWSERQADIYFQELIQSLNLIAHDPNSVGRSYEEIRANYRYRGFHSGRHIIFYRILQNGKVRIVRILHERMDFKKHL